MRKSYTYLSTCSVNHAHNGWHTEKQALVFQRNFATVSWNAFFELCFLFFAWPLQCQLLSFCLVSNSRRTRQVRKLNCSPTQAITHRQWEKAEKSLQCTALKVLSFTAYFHVNGNVKHVLCRMKHLFTTHSRFTLHFLVIKKMAILLKHVFIWVI